MTLADDYEPRFTFGITESQKRRADKILYQYGMRKAIFQILLDDVLDIIEKHGYIAVGVMLDGKTKPREIIPLLKKAEERSKE